MMMEKGKLIKRMIFIILYVIGFGVTVGGACFYWHVGKIEKEYKQTVAKIENIEKRYNNTGGKKKLNYYVTVSYQVDGVDYKREIGAYSSSMEIGKNINLMYNPADPNEVRSTEIEKIIAIVMTIAGIILLLSTWLIVPKLLSKVALGKV